LVVHAYSPNAGGSEYHTERVAKGMIALGHTVEVLTINPARTTGQYGENIIPLSLGILKTLRHQKMYDLIFVHGDMTAQNLVLQQAPDIEQHTPIYYALIRPREDTIIIDGMTQCRYIGWNSYIDYQFIRAHGLTDKARWFRYSVDPGVTDTGLMDTDPWIRQQYNIGTPYIYCATGGFSPHKRLQELINCFERADLEHKATLVVTGYDLRHPLPRGTAPNVLVVEIDDPAMVHELYRQSDLCIVNAVDEGHGLSIPESMAAGCEWISRAGVPAAQVHGSFGQTFETDDDLIRLMQHFVPMHSYKQRNKEYALSSLTVEQEAQDILQDIV
jgi:glycosyltransferase involved in cell wall biosynthesis